MNDSRKCSVQVLTLILLLLAVSCSQKHFPTTANTRNFPIADVNIQNVRSLNVNAAMRTDVRLGAIDTSPSHLVGIGTGIYPNSNQFPLGIPKFSKRTIDNISLESHYYFTPSDSLVKVVLYEWNDGFKWDDVDKFYQKEAFDDLFQSLRNKLTVALGEPTHVKIKSRKYNSKTVRDEVKWINPRGLNAYLFMFSNDDTKFKQIRLAVYEE